MDCNEIGRQCDYAGVKLANGLLYYRCRGNGYLLNDILFMLMVLLFLLLLVVHTLVMFNDVPMLLYRLLVGMVMMRYNDV